jgi:regulator of sigma E protease
MHEFLVAVVSFIVLVGIMVIVHEFGHFAMAKLFKVRVEAFSFGFGPRLFGFKYGDTDYKVCLLPLGGFVKMTGETPDQISGESENAPGISVEEDPGSFLAHPRWQRAVIGVAGPISNFILAFVLMVFYFGLINEVPDIKTVKLEWVDPTSVAGQAGLHAGDIVRRFGNAQNPDVETFYDDAEASQNQTVPITVDRDGTTLQTAIALPSDKGGHGGYDLSKAGLFLEIVPGPIVVDQVSAGAPADQAGLRSGDKIVAVDGHVFHTLEPMVDYLQSGRGAPVNLTVTRNGVPIPPIIVRPTLQDNQWRIGFSYIPPDDPPSRDQPMPLARAMDAAREFCAGNSMLIVDTLEKIFTRQVSMKQLSGPVGIARMAGQAAETEGWRPKFGLAAAISLNLGILNLLPFPILDGGLILFLVIEAFLRRDISMAIKERIYQAAFVLIVVFFAFVLFNDITKLPIFAHLKL